MGDDRVNLTIHYLRPRYSVLLPTETWYWSSPVPDVGMGECWDRVCVCGERSCSAPWKTTSLTVPIGL